MEYTPSVMRQVKGKGRRNAGKVGQKGETTTKTKKTRSRYIPDQFLDIQYPKSKNMTKIMGYIMMHFKITQTYFFRGTGRFLRNMAPRLQFRIRNCLHTGI
jgi:hypothetical protein